MSKGSKQRPTNKEAYDEGYERIFKMQNIPTLDQNYDNAVFDGAPKPTMIHKPLPRNIEEALDQLRELMIKDGHNYATIRGLTILRKE